MRDTVSKMPIRFAGLVVWTCITLAITYFVMSHNDVTWITNAVSNLVGH